MNTKSEQIIVKDKTILSFYKSNPNIDFITMNHVFIDILNKLSVNLTDTINNTTMKKMYTMVEQLTNDVGTIKSDILNKLQDIKTQYIAEIQTIISNDLLTTTDKIRNIIDKNNDVLMHKTNTIISETLPKYQNPMIAQIETNIKQLSNSLHKDNSNYQDYAKSIDIYFNKVSVNIQQHLQLTEDRTTNKLTDIHNKINDQHTSHDKLSGEMDTFLNKYKYNSTVKGTVSEMNLLPVLQLIYNKDVVERCSKESHTCDYRVYRHDDALPAILIENKDYSRSVITDEVRKFEHDLQKQNSHGIFLSQSTPIIKKTNYQIDIKHGLIHIYLNNVNYDYDKIKIAADIIDTLAPKLTIIAGQHSSHNIIPIQQEEIDIMMNEYCVFSKQKIALIDTIKSSNKQILEQLDNLQLNVIRKFVSKNNIGKLNFDDTYKCTICSAYYGKNKAGLAAHKKTCKPNVEPMTIVLETEQKKNKVVN